MAWTSDPDFADGRLDTDAAIIREARKRFRLCEQWEATARVWFEYDLKFANADSRNMYQWDEWVIGDRLISNRPCLTINKTQQHNLLIINDAKQNKPGVNIRPVGEDASFEAAQVYEEVVKHIEYISNAENVYDSATVFQVQAGIGYWRIITDFVSPKSMEQEIYVRRIKDPRSVFLDKDINEVDGSDARYGFIFEDIPKDLYKEQYPKFAEIGSISVFGNSSDNGWLTENSIRVCEYYRKKSKSETLVSFVDPQLGKRITEYESKLTEIQKVALTHIKEIEKEHPESLKTWREREVVTDEIEWFKIAGDQILETMRKSDWGRNIPVLIISNLNESDAPAGIRGMGIEGYAVKANLSNDQLDELVDSILTPANQKTAESLDVQNDVQPETQNQYVAPEPSEDQATNQNQEPMDQPQVDQPNDQSQPYQ